MTPQPAMDYAQILPQLFVGSHLKSAGEIDTLRQETGITAILNVQTDEDLRYCSVDLPPLAAHCKACGIELRRSPVRDFDAVDLRARLPECVRALDQLLAAGHTVYLHCTAGAGRAPSVAIAYLTWYRGWTFDDAVAHVTARRPSSPNLEAIRLATRDREMSRNPSDR